MGFWSELFADAEPPPCPQCQTTMVKKGVVAGSFGVEMINFTSDFFQCPKCKNVEIGHPEEPETTDK